MRSLVLAIGLGGCLVGCDEQKLATVNALVITEITPLDIPVDPDIYSPETEIYREPSSASTRTERATKQEWIYLSRGPRPVRP